MNSPVQKRRRLIAHENLSDDDDSGDDKQNSSSDDSDFREVDEVPVPRSSFYSNPEMDSSYEKAEPEETAPESAAPSFLAGTVAYEMMIKSGWKPKEGLGKSGQGRRSIIETSDQKGRTGFGFRLEDLDEAVANWSPEMEEITMQELVEWLPNDSDDLNEITRCKLDDWFKLDRRKETIDDETKFVHADILENVLKSKSIFDRIEGKDMGHARLRSNPFETLRGSIFMNRAAVKMANMDAILDDMFSNPVDENGVSLVRKNGLLYFADVCAGPGGFSEYILWRKKWFAKGFGFTMNDKNDFKLEAFIAGTPETFDPYYGVKNDGNIYVPDNIKSLTDYVLNQTESGVHFMMADGGFDVSGKENIQEIMSKQLYLCQCIVALAIIRENGHFVMKLFDIFTPFSVGLVYLMYKCFKQIAIIKPNTSRPANSERYLVCKWKKPNTDTIYRHLFGVNRAMYEHPKSEAEVLELVSHETLKGDTEFFEYIYNSNNRIGKNQIIGLVKIAAYYKNRDLKEERQAEIRAECLRLWKLPDDIRKKGDTVGMSNDNLCHELLKTWTDQIEFLNAPETLLLKENLARCFQDVHDWYFVALDTTEDSDKNVRTLFMSHGRRHVVMYNPRYQTWNDCPISIELSPNTLVYGEIVKELQGEGKLQITTYSFHIIDGIILGGIDIRKEELRNRIEMCSIFAEALNKPCKTIIRSGDLSERSVPIRCKQLFPLSNLERFFDSLSEYRLKSQNKSRLGFKLRNKTGIQQFFVPKGLLFIKSTQGHLQKLLSKKANKYYYADHKTKKSFFPESLADPTTINASFKSTFQYRRLWKWEFTDQVSETYVNNNPDSQEVYRTDLKEFIASLIDC